MNIVIENLSKVYKQGTRALNDINLEIESGMFGLLGPNGAGKTTLIRILVTLLLPTEGRVRYGDYDIIKDRRQIRSMTGFLPQQFSTFSKLKTWEFIDYSARLVGIKDSRKRKAAIDEMLENVGLYEARDRQANKLSGGMKRRLGIAQALVGSPRVLIVDEPTTGLDPEERIRFRNLLSEMSSNDIIIILSTHIVGDISSTCTNMAMLNKGKLVFNGSPEQIIDAAKGHVWLLKVNDMELESIKSRFPVISTIPSVSGWEVQIVSDKPDGFDGVPVEPNLEHAYVYYLEYILGQSWNDDLL